MVDYPVSDDELANDRTNDRICGKDLQSTL